MKEGKIVRLENERRGTSTSRTALSRISRTLVRPVHIFSFKDFFNITYVLDTPADLIGYLEMRTDVLIPTFHPKVHEEQHVFEYYLDHFEELTSFRAKHRGEHRPPELFKEHADMYRQIHRGDSEDLNPSYFIDKIIDWTHQIDESSPPPFDDAERDYVAVATYLGRLPRPRRQYIGKAFLDAIRRSGEAMDDDFAHFSSQRRNECLLFLASTRPPEERKERNKDLAELVSRFKATRQVERALGIVTEAGFGRRRSYDFVLFDSDPQHDMSDPDYDEIKRRGEEFFGPVIAR